ncbi:hypothetical protein RhiirC2_846591 [Rhizophagus irregularis]|uniref:Uncharacterized protein n=1 Tax=Rhizophagus irregularis TaxID=588596 RepID=A0A2N1NLJ5_9GLOM|nr:hypothetical protein RhiirC2_846591 [Rhizophagus irregularis]
MRRLYYNNPQITFSDSISQISGEKYRKLSKNLFTKAVKSPAIQLTFELKFNEDLELQLNQMEKAKELVSGTKTAIGLFLINSSASVPCINTLQIWEFFNISNLYNKLENITNNHQLSIQKYIHKQYNSIRIPSVTSKDQISHMATILFNTSEASPIPYYTCKSYNLVKSNWNNYCEGELMESLTVHSYDADLWERYGRKFDQTKLVDLLELSLKNTNNYVEAIQSFIELPEIKSYLEQYIIPIPADFPGQLFIRRAIVGVLKSDNNASISNNIAHLIPFLGPLHVSLNSRESLFFVFWSFFNQLYLIIFDAKKKLAAKPEPWRINLSMYLASSGWKLIKNIIVERFGNTKIIGYRTFFDLLDNLIPATLDIYLYGSFSK